MSGNTDGNGSVNVRGNADGNGSVNMSGNTDGNGSVNMNGNTDGNRSESIWEKRAARQGGSVRELTLVGVMAAVICVLGPLSIPLPVSPVPISLTNLAIYFTLYILGMKRGCVSYCIYLLIGLVGLPVFSSFTGGPGKLLGPTGGYLIGFIMLALIGGFFIDRWQANMGMCFAGMALGTAVCYLFGTLWLAYQARMPFAGALAAGVIPFIPGDLAKIIIAMLAGPQIRKRLQRAGLV